jgi:ketosteroid isomerase-like protein
MTPDTDQESHAAADRAREHSHQRNSIKSMLRRRLEALAQAIRDKDLHQLMTFYDRDVEVFDLRASLNLTGTAAYRDNLEHWFALFEGPLGFELHNLRIVPGEPTAFCHYLALITGARSGGRISGYWIRGTTGFERRGGEWLITHEHISQPGAM